MSKAVLVIDMPKRCKDCFRYRADAWFGGSCRLAKKEDGWNEQIGADDEYNVQNWCPLRPYEESIPIEWIKEWEQKEENYYLYKDLTKKLIEDWEKENEKDI